MLIQICETTPRGGLNQLKEMELDTIYERGDLYTTYEGKQHRVWGANFNKYIVINAIMTPNLDGLQITLLTLASKGFSNEEIGIELELSERTIKNYFTKIYKQMRTAKYPRINRTLACCMAMSKGIIGGIE